VNVAGFPLRCNNRGLSQTALAIRTNNSSSEASGNFTPAMVMNMLSMCAQMGGNPQATSAGLANLQINQKKRKAIEDTPGKPASPESKDVNVAKTTPAVEAVGTAEPASMSAKPLLALENQAPALENKALELPVFDSQPEDEKVSDSAGVPTDVLNALDSREKAKAKSKGAPKAASCKATPKGKPKAKPKAKSGAQPKAKPGAKPKAKPGATPKAKPEAKPQPKSLAKKRCTRESSVGGWIVEVRYRPDGQTDKHYLSPCGKSYRTAHEARTAGWKG